MVEPVECRAQESVATLGAGRSVHRVALVIETWPPI
jgi:hypothetical protein